MMTILLALASVRTVTYARQWNDRLGFYESAARNQPKSVRMHHLLADEYTDRGDLENAARASAAGRAASPEDFFIWYQSAKVAMLRGELDEAERFVRHAFKLQNQPFVLTLLSQIKQMRAATQPATASSPVPLAR